MLQWWRSVLAAAKERSEARERGIERPPYIPIGLSSMPGGIIVDEGLPRPQWALIRHEMNRRFSSSAPEALWHWASVEWLNVLAKSLGGSYAIHESENFLYLSPTSVSEQRGFCRKAESTLRQLRYFLGEAATKKGHGKYVILRLHDEEIYYRYISHFYSEGESPGSGAIFIHTGYRHIVLKIDRDEDLSLIHEMFHCLVADLHLPRWLNEGMAQEMEEQIPRIRKHHRHEIHEEHRQFWSEKTIQGFWSGASFELSGKSNKLSYSLAQILAHLLETDLSKGAALEFIAHADRRDGGEAAAKRYLGCTLGELASTYLGRGNWEPKVPPGPPEPRDIYQKKWRLILEFIRGGRIPDARSVWELLVSSAPNDEERVAILGGIAALPAYDELCVAFAPDALELVEQAKAYQPNVLALQVTRAALLLCLKASAEAASILRPIAEGNGEAEERVAASWFLCMAELDLGNRAEAEKWYRIASAADPAFGPRYRVERELFGIDEEWWKEGVSVEAS